MDAGTIVRHGGMAFMDKWRGVFVPVQKPFSGEMVKMLIPFHVLPGLFPCASPGISFSIKWRGKDAFLARREAE